MDFNPSSSQIDHISRIYLTTKHLNNSFLGETVRNIKISLKYKQTWKQLPTRHFNKNMLKVWHDTEHASIYERETSCFDSTFSAKFLSPASDGGAVFYLRVFAYLNSGQVAQIVNKRYILLRNYVRKYRVIMMNVLF